MYTGKLISELMAAVDRVEQKAERRRIVEDRELQAIFSMQIPVTPGDPIFSGQVFRGAA
jgi:hypothetical protein